MSQFLDALRNGVRCPKCEAANRPGAWIIDIDADGRASCNQCGHGWIEPLLTRTPR